MTEVLQIRDAAVADLRQIINLLRDDPLGQSRESGDVEVYYKAFARMSEAVGNVYMLATFGEQIVGCLQFTIIHGLSRAGAARAQIEGVRVHREHRGAGIGEALMVAAIGRARAEGCTDRKSVV